MSVAVVALSLVACSAGSSTPGASSSPVSSMAPVGDPSDLTPQAGTGNEESFGDVGTVTVPEGTTASPGTPTTAGAEQIVYRMPGGDAQGFPALQVTWQADAPAGAYEQSWSTENTKKVDTTVSDYVRSPVEWPGSDASVVSTWTEEIALQTGDSVDVDATALWLQTPDGTVVLAIAFSPAGESDSSSVEALRTLTLS